MSGKDRRIISALVVGCGNRGEVYASYALHHPDRFAIVGIAEPKEHLRTKFLQRHKDTIETANVFEDWRDIFKGSNKKISDCVIIALPDRLHKDAALAFLDNGYHVLMEKPMATTLQDCRDIALCSERNPHLINAVCHVLRYHKACLKLKELIDSGVIGKVVNINHTEPVGFWHFAHSFVRGNWRNEEVSCFSLLAKCCHDIDLLVYWMGDSKKCISVSSFGSLVHFTKENKPHNATDNCFTCPVERQCCYSAKRLYVDRKITPSSWPWSVVLDTDALKLKDQFEDIEDILKNGKVEAKAALVQRCLENESSSYGRCVYSCDNDVCDNQVVVMNFDDGSTATLTMIAFSSDVCTRKTRIYGTKGELEWDDASPNKVIIHRDFLTRKVHEIPIENPAVGGNNETIRLSGHGGSDYLLIDKFVESIANSEKALILTDIKESFKSHAIVFAAEMSRLQKKTIEIGNQFSL